MPKNNTLSILLLIAAVASAAPTAAHADSFNAVAYDTSGLTVVAPVNRIDTAHLNRDTVVLYVDWKKIGVRAYRTEVRIFDPNGRFVGTIRNTNGLRNSDFSTYYYYRPGLGNISGYWTYKMHVDGRDALEARIPVVAAN